MNNFEIIEWINQYAESMFLRPGMYCGNMPENKDCLEVQILLLLQFKAKLLNFNGERYVVDIWRKFARSHCKNLNIPYFWAGGALSTCNTEEEIIKLARTTFDSVNSVIEKGNSE